MKEQLNFNHPKHSNPMMDGRCQRFGDALSHHHRPPSLPPNAIMNIQSPLIDIIIYVKTHVQWGVMAYVCMYAYLSTQNVEFYHVTSIRCLDLCSRSIMISKSWFWSFPPLLNNPRGWGPRGWGPRRRGSRRCSPRRCGPRRSGSWRSNPRRSCPWRSDPLRRNPRRSTSSRRHKGWRTRLLRRGWGPKCQFMFSFGIPQDFLNTARFSEQGYE